MITEDWGEGEQRVGSLWLGASRGLSFQCAERTRTEGQAAGGGSEGEAWWKWAR